MKNLFVHWKLIVISLTIFLIAGLSSYFYFGHLQHELDKTTQSVQSTAIQAMEKKEKQQKKTNSSQSTESNSTDGSQNSEVKISDPKKQLKLVKMLNH